MGKDSPSPPAAPDYAGAATAQGAANVETARLQGRMNNPNISGPLGSQTVTFGTPSFDQANYDKAMSAYQANPRGAVPMQNQFYVPTGYDDQSVFDTAGYQNAMNKWAAGTNAPTREQYTTTTGGDQPTITQTLTPQAQATLDAQQRVQRALAGLGEQGLGTASRVLGTGFNPNLAGLQTNLGNAGQISQAPDLSRYGQASGLQGQQLGDGRGNRPLTVEETTSMNNPDVFRGKNAPPPSTGNLGNDVEMPPEIAARFAAARAAGMGPSSAYQPTGNLAQTLQAPELSAYGMAQGGPQSGQYGFAGAGPQAGQYGYAGANVRTGAINQGPQAGDFGNAQGNVAAPQLQNQIDTSGVGNVNYGPQTDQYGLASGGLNTSNVAAMPVNAGMTGQQAIMNRLAPQLEKSDAAMRQRLANQGLVAGGEAYENAMLSQNQQKNDLLSQAALQGIGLDTAANAQGFNQALQGGQFGNQAIAQNFNQAQAAQAAQNAAQNQAFGQRVQSGQFGNQAQLASFGAGMQNAGLFNSALNQNLNTALATQQAQNAAQQQGYAQQMGAAGLQNQAIGQNFGQGVTAQQLQNAGIGQNFGQGQAANAAANQAVNQNQQAALAQYQAQLGGQQQGFGQNVTQRQLGNQAITQNQQAALQQQQAALAAQNQQFNQLLQGGQFGNTAQQQSLQQQLALRNQPLNEITGLMGGSQIQMPQFQGYQGSNIAAAPVFAGAQAAGQAAMDQYGIQSSNVNAQNAGLYNLAGAGLMAARFSDRRLKSNIEQVGTHPLGIGIYEYDIFGNRERGVMADEVLRVLPNAVSVHPSGFMQVDYGMLQ